MSELKLYHVHWILLSQVEVMPYYRWGWFLYLSRVVVRVREIVRVKVMVRVEGILYTFGSPESKLKQCCIIGECASCKRAGWLSEFGKVSESK